MKKILSILIILFSVFIGYSQVDVHNGRVKIKTVNELSAVGVTTKVAVIDPTNGEVKYVEVQNLPISGNTPEEVTQVEAETGTETELRSWSPFRVKQAIDALGSGDLSNYVTLDGIQTITGQNTFSNPLNYFGNPASNHLRMYGNVPSIEAWSLGGLWSALRPDQLIFNNGTSVFLKPNASSTDTNYNVFMPPAAGVVLTEEKAATLYATIGSSGSGDALLAGTQTFTGLNTFSQPVTITGASGGILNMQESANNRNQQIQAGESSLIFNLKTAVGGDKNYKLNANGVTNPEDVVDKATLDAAISGVSSTGNPNITVANSLTDITNASTNAKIDIQGDIVLTGNYSAPPGQTWDFTTGSINYGAFTLTLNDTKTIFHEDHKSIFGTTGTLAGTSNTPIYIHVDNLGCTADGVELLDGLTNAGNTTFSSSNATFTAADVGKFIAIQGADSGWLGVDVFNSIRSHITTIATFIDANTVTLAVAPTRGVTNARFVYGTDNFDALKQVAFLRNQSPGQVHFGVGTYFKHEVSREALPKWGTDPSGLFFGNGTHDLTFIGHNSILRSIPHNLENTRMITLKNTKRFKSKGLLYQGEKPFHQYSNGNPGIGDEFVHGIFISDAVINPRFTQGVSFEFEGDGVNGDYDLQFNNYIQGANFTSGNTASDLTLGTIDDVTGVKTADTNAKYAYTTTRLDISTSQYENSRALHPTGKGLRSYSYAGSSFAGWSGMKTPRYWAYYYDASNNYLYKSGEQRFYDVYEYPDEVKYVDIVIEKPIDIANINTQVRSPMQSYGAVFDSFDVRDCGRHAFANLPSFTSWYNSVLQGAGPNQPGYLGNIEDYRDAAMYYHFDNIIWKDAAYGGLNFVGTIGVNVTDCFFLGTSEPLRKRVSSPFVTGVGQSGARDATVSGTLFRNTTEQFDRSNKFTQNIKLGGSIEVSANGNFIGDNDLHNVSISSLPTVDVDREVSMFKGNRMTYDKPWDSYLFRETSNSMIWKDITVKFNSKARVTFEVDYDYVFEDIVLNENGGNKLWNPSPVPTVDYGGYWEDVSITGARPALAARDYTYSSVPLLDMKNVHIGTSISFQVGLPKDRTFTNLTVDGGIEFQLDQFETSIVSTTPILTFNDLKINIEDADFDWTNVGAKLIDVDAKNVGFVFNGGELNLNLASTVTGTSNKFFEYNGLGDAYFNYTKWYSQTAKNIDFTNTSIVGSTAGNIHLKFKTPADHTNITFTLRAGDTIEYTEINYDITNRANGYVLAWNSATNRHEYVANSSGGGSGTVTSVSVVTANGLSGTVANATTIPAITLNIDSALISSKTTHAGLTGTEEVLINDGGTLNKTTTQAIANLASGGGTSVLYQTFSITNPVITTGSYTQSNILPAIAGKVYLILSINTFVSGATVVNNTSISVRYNGDGADVVGGTAFLSGGNGVSNYSASNARYSDFSNTGLDVVITNPVDQTITGTIKGVITYVLMDI